MRETMDELLFVFIAQPVFFTVFCEKIICVYRERISGAPVLFSAPCARYVLKFAFTMERNIIIFITISVDIKTDLVGKSAVRRRIGENGESIKYEIYCLGLIDLNDVSDKLLSAVSPKSSTVSYEQWTAA